MATKPLLLWTCAPMRIWIGTWARWSPPNARAIPAAPFWCFCWWIRHSNLNGMGSNWRGMDGGTSGNNTEGKQGVLVLGMPHAHKRKPKGCASGNPNCVLERTCTPPSIPCHVQCSTELIWWKTPVGSLTPKAGDTRATAQCQGTKAFCPCHAEEATTCHCLLLAPMY